MIIAISQRNMKMDKGSNRDALENDYVKYYENFGITLLPIPNVSKDLNKYFDDIDINGIILSGGDDVNPTLYGSKPENEIVSEERDNTEKKLVDIAIEKNLPLLGNCRGAQFINVYFKGKLIRDVKSETGIDHVNKVHKIKIIDEKASYFLNKKELSVNSFHNQGITKDSLSSKLKAFALTDDGIIEGFYHQKYPIAGILWHPERDGSNGQADRKLIEAFLNKKFFWKIK